MKLTKTLYNFTQKEKNDSRCCNIINKYGVYNIRESYTLVQKADLNISGTYELKTIPDDITIKDNQIIFDKTIKPKLNIINSDNIKNRIFNNAMSYDLTFQYSIDTTMQKLKLIQKSMAKKDVRYFLNGAYFDAQNNAMVATDGHRMNKVDNDFGNIQSTKNIIIPNYIMYLLIKLKVVNADIYFGEYDGLTCIETLDYEIYFYQVDGRYPEYQRVIPQNNNKCLTIPVDELNTNLTKIKKYANKHNSIFFNLTKDKLSLNTKNDDLETFSIDGIHCAYDHPEIEIGFNVQYILDVLTCHNAKDNISIYFGDQKSSMLIKHNNTLSVIMPVRI